MKYSIYVYFEDVVQNWLVRINEGLKVASDKEITYTLTSFFENPDHMALIKKAFSSPMLFFYGIPLTKEAKQILKELDKKDRKNYKVIMKNTETEAKLMWLQEVFGVKQNNVIFINSDDEIKEHVNNNHLFILNDPKLTEVLKGLDGNVIGSFNSVFKIEDSLYFLHKLDKAITERENHRGNL